MARALDKVQKKISKKRGSKPTALHENSRDAKRLRAAGAREDKLAKLMTAAARSNQQYIDRALWFQGATAEAENPLTSDRLRELVGQFIARQEDELKELVAAQRPGRPRSKVEDQIRDQIETEEREYKSGFWVPEVRDVDSLELLRKYGGSWGGLNSLKLVRVVKDGEIRASSFPPKGLS